MLRSHIITDVGYIFKNAPKIQGEKNLCTSIEKLMKEEKEINDDI